MQIRGDLSGRFATGNRAGDAALDQARIWAEQVMLAVVRVREAQAFLRETYWGMERGEEWSPTELDAERVGRHAFAENATLIWTAHQLDQGLVTLEEAVGQVRHPPWSALKHLRNALEHLNEARFEDGYALPAPGDEKKSLGRLPGGRLPVDEWEPGFGVVELDDLRERARAFLNLLDAEVDAVVEGYLAQERGR